MSHTEPIKLMSEEDWRHLCARIPTGWCIEINALGEHSTHPQFEDFIAYLSAERTGEVFLKWSTNGMWGTPSAPWITDRIEPLLSCFSTLSVGCDRSQIIFSIDGFNPETIEYIRRGIDVDRVMQNIRFCIGSSDVEIGIAFVAMRRNLQEASLLLRSLPGLKYFYLNILNVCTEEMIPESLIDMKTEYDEAIHRLYEIGNEMGTTVSFLHPILNPKTEICGCNFPKYLWVDTEGSVHPCCRRWDRTIGHVSQNWNEIVSSGRRALGEMIVGPSCDLCFSEGDAWGWQRHFLTKELYDEYKHQKGAEA